MFERLLRRAIETQCNGAASWTRTRFAYSTNAATRNNVVSRTDIKESPPSLSSNSNRNPGPHSVPNLAHNQGPIAASSRNSGALLSSSSSSSPSTASTWTRKEQRTGILATKKGMMSFWDEWGVRHAATVLHLDHVQALDTFRHGEALIQNIGIGTRSARNTHPAQLRHFLACGVAPKMRVRGFPISEQAALPRGTFLRAAHFVPGQLVDVQARSIGKGFQGGMKRWGFHGMPASHGVSLAHRAIGATGARSDPGRVFPGKKMPGRLGGNLCTLRRLRILKIDTALDCIWVRGSVPGPDNAIVRVVDSTGPENRAIFRASPPPFPTLSSPNSSGRSRRSLPRTLVAPVSAKDPLYRPQD